MEEDKTKVSEENIKEEKRHELYKRQKKLLETFLEKGAISESQYRKSLSDLSAKMGYSE